MFHSTKRHMARGLLTLGFLLAAGSAWAEAGRVMFVSGQASLIRGGTLPIIKGISVEAGDTIVTGADGRVQLLMADGDRIALRPNSHFSIDEFSGPSRTGLGEPVVGTRPSSWKSFYTLAQGGFRTLTQSLGERDASSYQVRTPVATIGIRGTDYTLLYCPAGCAAYKSTTSNGVRVEGMQASVFRESAGSRLLFAALGVNWVQEFLKAQAQGEGGGSDGVNGELFGGVSKGEIEVKDPSGDTNSVKDNEFFKADNEGFNKLPEMPDGLTDQTTSDGEGDYDEQVGEGEGEGEEFSARTDPSEGDGSGGGKESGDGSVGDVTLEFGTADTGTTDSSSAPVLEIIGTDSSGNTGSFTSGSSPPPPASPPLPPPPEVFVERGIATGVPPHSSTAHGGFSGNASAVYSEILVGKDGSGRIVKLAEKIGTDVSTLELISGQGSSINDGFDLDGGTGANSATGLQWGRWTGKITVTYTNTAPDTVDFGDSSYHFVFGPESGSTPVIPISGSYDYALIGNTNPTDNHGNVGVLGSASFHADFTSGSAFVSSSLNLGINGQTWNASSGSAPIGANGVFAGSYGSVEVTNGSCGSGPCTGNGDFAGFFTPGGSSTAPPPGAGMGYHLEEGSTEVSGVAAFGNPTESGSVGGGGGGLP